MSKTDLNTLETVLLETNLADAVNGLSLSERDRWMAAQALAKGEAISDLVCGALESLRTAAALGIRLFARDEPASDQTQA